MPKIRTRFSVDTEGDAREGGRSGKLRTTRKIDEVLLLFFRRSLSAGK